MMLGNLQQADEYEIKSVDQCTNFTFSSLYSKPAQQMMVQVHRIRGMKRHFDTLMPNISIFDQS